MLYRIAADCILLLHFAFILFVLLGGLLVFKWRWLAWLHIPVAIWGAMIVIIGWICPLTPLENWLRYSAGEQVYTESFIEHYLMPVIYPAGLNQQIFITMGIVVIIINLFIYAVLIIKRKPSDM